jgi:FkbM family methyltransferase
VKKMEEKVSEAIGRNNLIETFLSFVYKALWRLIPSLFKLTRVIHMDGFLIAYRPFLASDRGIINPNFEKNIKSVFLPKSGEIVIDVGANIGIYTLLSSRKVEPEGKVIAIEPDESNLAVLRKNITINKCKNVTVIPVALGSSNGKQKFYEGIMPTASSFYPENKRLLYKVRSERTIKVFTLDYILEKLGIEEINWIKIDAEKADLGILHGSESTLRRSQNLKVIVEASSPQTFSYLQNIGFKINTDIGFASKA